MYYEMNKAELVKEVEVLLNKCGQALELSYDNECEIVTVTYSNGYKKRLSIGGDSNAAAIVDIVTLTCLR